MACPECGAPNASSRERCARCRTDLHEGPDAGPEPDPDTSARSPVEGDGPSLVLVVATVVAVVAGLGVMAAILTAQGIGPLAAEVPDVVGDAETATVVEAQASSEREPSEDRDYAATNVLDADPSAAWVAGEGGRAWIQLELSEVEEVVGLVIWNGYQDDDRFARHDRVSSLTIETDDRRFKVDLLDTRGPMAVDLPEAVPASRVRLVADEVYSGDEVEGPALSGVEVRTEPGT